MNGTRMLAQSLGSLRRYKLRSAFMMLGSFVGVAALTLAVSLGEGMQAKVMRTVRQVLGESSVIVVGGGGRLMGTPRANAARLTIDDVAAVVKEVPGIEDWDPQAELSRTAVKRGELSATVRLLGDSERWQRVWGRGVSRGEDFDASAVNGSARVAIIGETVAHAVFPDADPIGAEILIGAVPFRVIGVLERFGVDMHGMDRDNEIVVPITTLMRRLSNADAIGAAKLLVTEPSAANETAKQVAGALRRRHSLDRDQPDDFVIVTALQAQEMVSKVRRVLLLYVPLASGVILLVGGIVAAALMLGSVSERVGEIGLRRAVGALPSDIRRQFVVETAITVVIGGVAGIAAAYLILGVVAMHVDIGLMFSWKAVVTGVVSSAVTGALAGVIPARRAAMLEPAVALR